MPHSLPRYLNRDVTRHGKTVCYVRIGRGPRIRIKAEFGTVDFEIEYQAAVSGKTQPSKNGPSAGSLTWLIDRYRETSAWTSLSMATRRQRENILKQIIGTAGSQRYTAITSATIAAGRDRRSQTPFQARHFLDTMRGLFEWAMDARFVKTNPAASVKYPLLKSGEGFPVWTEDDVAAYERRWPLGTKERVWLTVLLYTGLRRGDAVRIGKQHVRNGIATLRTQKSGGKIEVQIPLLPPLVEALDAGPTADLAFVCGSNGKPMTKESFGNAFADACRKAGISKSAHGLRKIGATRAANNGATVAQLNAIFGWTGSKMASLYTQNADRARLARDAMSKLLNDTGTDSPAPLGQVRALGRKDERKQRRKI
jgi:integrase